MLGTPRASWLDQGELLVMDVPQNGLALHAETDHEPFPHSSQDSLAPTAVLRHGTEQPRSHSSPQGAGARRA